MDHALPSPELLPATNGSIADLAALRMSPRRRRLDPPHGDRNGVDDVEPGNGREQLRARLLAMIMENERIRRSEKRAAGS